MRFSAKQLFRPRLLPRTFSLAPALTSPHLFFPIAYRFPRSPPPHRSLLVQADSIRVKAVVSLGGLYVLNFRRPPPPPLSLPSARQGNGGRVPPPFDSSAATSAGHRQLSRGRDDRGSFCVAGDDDDAAVAPLPWVESVLGRGEGAVGPMLDVALVVVPCGKRGGLLIHGAPGSGGRAVAGPGGGGGGVEARVKVRLDAVRANLSIPFVENLTRHVLAGPLASLLLQEDDVGGGGGAPRSLAGEGSITSTPLPPLSSGVPGGARAPADEILAGVGAVVGSDGAAAAGGGAARWEGEGGAAALQQGGGAGVEGEDSWERLVFVKVRRRVGAVQYTERMVCRLVAVDSTWEAFRGKNYCGAVVSRVPRGSVWCRKPPSNTLLKHVHAHDSVSCTDVFGFRGRLCACFTPITDSLIRGKT